MDVEELELIARCQQGDHEALKEIFQKYHQKVYRIAYGVVRQREDALDIVQEVFIKLYRSIKNFKGKSNFYTYLYRMTLNHAIDYSRKMKKSPFLRPNWEKEPEPIEEETQRPDYQASKKQFEERVKRAMERLSEDQRGILILREIEGLSYQEIVEIMKCSLGTVMSRIHYGRKKLRELLKEEWEG